MTLFPVAVLVTRMAGTSEWVWPLTMTSMPETFCAMR
jgi:hypothetical protein